jgi:DNA-directed RNA polymerase subunit M/transcription elongation factor TFIIS
MNKDIIMKYVTMPFTCEKCGKKLEAHVAAQTGSGGAGHKAICPSCGKAQGSFPEYVIEVVEVANES